MSLRADIERHHMFEEEGNNAECGVAMPLHLI